MKKRFKPDAQIYSDRMKDFIHQTGMPLKQMSDVLNCSAVDVLDWWSSKKDLQIKEQHFTNLKSLVAVSEASLIAGTYDVELVRKRIFTDLKELPERYQQNQNSFVRTSYHIVKYLKLTRGQAFVDNILCQLNVSPLIYSDLNQKINLDYFVDLLEAISNAGLSKSEMDSLSCMMFLTMHETKIGKIVGSADSVPDVYKLLSENFEFFDTNFEYNSTFVGRKYQLKTVLPLTKLKQADSTAENFQRLLRYRQILIAWFPYLVGMNPLFPVTEVDIKGDQLLVSYEFKFDIPKRPLSVVPSIHSV